MSLGRTPQRCDTFAEDGVSTEDSSKTTAGAADVGNASSVRTVPPLEPAARDDNNSDHFDMDNLSLADILAEFDVHLVETLGEKNKSTAVQSATENNETKTRHQPCNNTSDVSLSRSQFTSFKGHPVSTLNSDVQPVYTPSQSRKFVTFSDNVKTYRPPVTRSGSLIYISAGNRSSALAAHVAPHGPQLPVTSSSSSPMSERHAIDYDNYDVYIRSYGDDDQFFDQFNKLRQVNDKNVYDDVEVLPRNVDVTSSTPHQTPKSNHDGNDVVTSNEDVTREDNLSDFAVQRTVAIMLAWVLTGLLTGLLCSYLYTWRLHYDVTYEQFSRSFVVEGVGTVLGALLFWATSSVSCCSCGDATIGVAMVMLAAYPCYYNFIYFLTSAFVFGIAKGLLFTASISMMKRQWDISKSSICIHILYISMAIGWFISVHLGRPFVEQILVFTSFSSDSCLGNATVLTSSANVTDDVVADAVKDDTHNATACDVMEASKVRFPVVYIPLAFISLSLAVFFFCLSCCHCCMTQRRAVRTNPTADDARDEFRRQSTGDVSVENDYIRVEDLRREMATVEQNKVSDGNNNNNSAGGSTTEVARRATEGRSKEADDKQTTGKGEEMSESSEQHEKSTVRFQDSSDHLTASKRPKNKHRSARTSKWFQGEQTFDVPILMFLYVFHFIPSGVELGLGRFMSIYAGRNRLLLLAGKPQDSSADSVNGQMFDRSVLLVTMFWGAVIFGRLLSVCVGMRRPLISIFFTISCPVLQFLSAVILTAYGNQFLSMLWPFVALFGCSIGPVSPGSWTWADIFLTSDAKSVAAGVAVSALGGSVITWLTGLGVDYYGSTSLWLMAAAGALLAGLFAIPVVSKLEEYRSRVNEERRRRRPRSTYV